MDRIVAIFLKDARHLRPQIAMLVLLMALSAILDPTYSTARASYYDLLPLLILPVACWLVIVSVIHEEKLPGDRQYWLTRPYCWKELLAAKLLFLAAFVNFPMLLCHAAIFTAVGIQFADQIEPLFWRQVFFHRVLYPARGRPGCYNAQHRQNDCGGTPGRRRLVFVGRRIPVV